MRNYSDPTAMLATQLKFKINLGTRNVFSFSFKDVEWILNLGWKKNHQRNIGIFADELCFLWLGTIFNLGGGGLFWVGFFTFV